MSPARIVCSACGADGFTNHWQLGAHKRYQCGKGDKKKPTIKPVKVDPNLLYDLPHQDYQIPTHPVPVPCACCFARMPDVEKGLAVVLIRAGMSIERAQKTIVQMRPILARANGDLVVSLKP